MTSPRWRSAPSDPNGAAGHPRNSRSSSYLFTDLLQDNYIGTIESYSGDKVGYNREIQDKDNAEVQTTLTTRGEAAYSINYRLRLVGKDWKVYDVIIENISVVNNYRSQFSRVISKSSYEELVRTMKEKALSRPQ